MILRHMDTDKMAESASTSVPRPRDPPLPDEVLSRMAENEPYVVADLVAEFEDEYGTARGTVRNRLEYLVDEGEVKRKKHANGTVTYRRPK